MKNEKVSSNEKMSRRTKKELKHHIFLELQAVCSDKFWKVKLEEASRDIFPKWFSYAQGELIYRKNSKVKSVRIDATNLEESCYAFISFLQEYARLFSENDKKTSAFQDHVQTQRSSIEVLTWEKCSSKMKPCLISEYIKLKTEELGLSKSEVQNLQSVIAIGQALGKIDKNDIVIEKRTIVDISSVQWDEDERRFVLERYKPLNGKIVNRSRDRLGTVAIEALSASEDTKMHLEVILEKSLVNAIRSCDKRSGSKHDVYDRDEE